MRALSLAVAVVLVAGGCTCGKKDEGSSAVSGSSAETPVEVGDRLHEEAPRWTPQDLEAYPAPAPVATVATLTEIPRLPPAAAVDQPTAEASNKAAKLGLLSVTRTATLPGLVAPEGKEFLVLHTRWENIHPRVKVRKEDLQADYTMGVGGFAQGRGGQGKPQELIEADVAYRVPAMEDHAWLVADGVAYPLDAATVRLYQGAPYRRPFTLLNHGSQADLRLAYVVPRGTRDVALQFFDDDYGHISLPVEGDAKKATSSSAPNDAIARAANARVELLLSKVEDRAQYAGVTAPEGWRFVVVSLTGRGLPSEKLPAPIVQIDPRSYIWAVTAHGHVRYASGGSVGHKGLLRFPPNLYQRNEVAFALPKGEPLSRVVVRDGRELLELRAGDAPVLPRALGTAHDGEVMDVELVGLWRSDDETVVDVVVKSRVAASGVELQPQQFKLTAGGRQFAPDWQRTATLLHRPPNPFVVPPRGVARFELSFATAEPPQTLDVFGLSQEKPIAVALTGIAESGDQPGRGDPTTRADDLIPKEPDVLESGAGWSDSEATAVVFGGPRLASADGAGAASEPPPFPDDREPNDSVDRASALGEDRLARGSFGTTSDEDHYRFTVSGAPALWRIEAVGKSVARIGYQGVTTSSAKSASAEGGRATIHDLLLAPGEHFLSLRGDGKTTGADAAYEVRVVLQGAQPEGYEGEPNDSPQRAHDLRLGETRRGRLPDDEDADAYRFSLVRREHVTISLASPPDGRDLFELSAGAFRVRGEALEKGGRARWEGWLNPGDYALTLRAREPSIGVYELRAERLDPFVTSGDLEPNDDEAHAVPLSSSLIASGNAHRPDDVDCFALPVSPKEQVVTATLSGRIGEGWIRTGKAEVLGPTPSPGDRHILATIPPNVRAFLTVRPEGEYAVELSIEGGPAAVREQLLGWKLSFPSKVEPFAAWWHQAQRRELPLTVENSGDADGEVALRAWSSHPEWRVTLPAKVTVARGKSVTVPVAVHVAADAWADRPVRIAVEVKTANGARRVVTVDVSAECGAAPSDPKAGYAVPEALLGGLDLASLALGGTASGDDHRERLDSLRSGLVTLDRNFYDGRLPIELTFDLAGDEPLPVAGFLLHPPGGPEADPPRDFEVLLSEDGQTFTRAISATLEPEAREQAFVLPRPVPARFARLRLVTGARWRELYSVGLASFKVVAAPGKVPSGFAAGFNLADLAMGGHVVWADESFPTPATLLTAVNDELKFRPDSAKPGRFVIGFHHERAAMIRGLEWQSTLPGAKVAVSTESPFGPWTPVGTLEATGASSLTFEKPVWARYVQFTMPELNTREYQPMPEAIRIFEVPAGGAYRSVLGEWGLASRESIYEQLVPRVATPVAQAAPHRSQEKALALAAGSKHQDSVERGVDEDWFRIDVPEGHNTLRFSVDSEDLNRLQWRLVGADGKEVRLQRPVQSATQVDLVATVEAQKTYFLQVQEPIRSVVFAWDSSGSVQEYHPQIYRAISRFAASVQPGRERVQLLPFVGNMLPTWGSDPVALQEAIHEYDERDGSSDAEGALTVAARDLATATGSRAVMIVTDDDSGASYQTEAQLWSWLSDVRPRVFSVQIPLGSQPALFQDRMQSWASVSAGHYATFRSSDDLDLAFDRAVCLMRRPAPYALSLETSHTVPPAPGRLVVHRDGPAPDGTAFEIIFDASGSMHKKLGKQSRVEIARAVLSNLVSRTIPAGTPVALRAFGHKEPRSCRTDLVVPLSPLDRGRMAETIRKIDPKDRSGTPLAASLKAVGDDLERAGDKKVVVLVTDGEESCGGDPGAAIQELKTKGIDVRLNIVGFAIDGAAAHQEFERWAELSGGRYYNAKSDKELTTALEQALNPTFQVLDATGEVLQTGTVNASPVEVPPGEYTVKVLSTPPQVMDHVKVESAKDRVLSLPGR